MDDRTVLTNHVLRMTDTLLKAGVKAAVISPGSRSTPLAYAFAASKELQTYMQVDERSAGYFALGLAKATGNPVALLCTSGTAASNYHPAITEAFYARVPLIVLTADRPHELRGVGAPQAIDQLNMYGKHVKFSVDLPLAEENEELDWFLERHVNRAVSIAMTKPMGPIHLNVPLREPLLIDFEMKVAQSTFIERVHGEIELSTQQRRTFQSLFENTKNGLIIAGELPVGFDKERFWEFANKMQWPVLCDPLSNLRSEVPEEYSDLCIAHYDAILKSEKFAEGAVPDTVIRFGPQPVSKPLSLFLKKVRPNVFIAVDEAPEFRDSLGVVTHHLQASPESVFDIPSQSEPNAYTAMWSAANDLTETATHQYEGQLGDEGIIVKTLFQMIPDGSDLFCGSSMPIRDVDTFFSKTNKDIALFSNRGTNGIDGVVSTAFGLEAARKRPTYLLIGDLSFLHDVNGLIVSRFHETSLTIVLVNNDGGGIFSYLSQSTVPNHFEELFGTPTGLTFEHIGAMYDAQYAAVNTVEEFKEEIQKDKTKPVRIIEVFTSRPINVKAHRAYWADVVERLDGNE
ncbi:2-succinyl-5-enolpyruvyl-6-hydroxy-3-cyclohexene-1-carboxylic-acid synthase [Sporosarcina thermotolerans]|uniref:2-succinyl-5-enolpyruvyl-6-hydroxy-3-cyclohexene-1-carboxylate synthase n=1 Tax=Sporosarcina thermotolerans TaxID=633404 RepID=A0AAW9A638_9BACL|nr:2-succinyl-5-enolpyruvyl-6-hydroxy-3-cyclohexene-1-carboxylic-acid synthase [Sporosarcina thermotolerans]MDW0116048.1 2-succinyl-5-enolpyruvyl-6-hydroxy-3-cyclohexene-1-carboxylic-acid synthase [Sporosarcina thermotolerans]WHT49772.1 2-succinyl-5-enolpyruvyl-6-hydroxy-3-cyclohexene-1-carboxylic-acid synthase [Sporosarcina thermotolerans]